MRRLFPALVAVLAAGPVGAAALQFESQNSGFSGFTIEFDDTDGDGEFDLSELLTFSGLSRLVDGTVFSTLLAVPDIDGFIDSQDTFWIFAEAGADRGPIFRAETFGPVAPPAVPLPASVLLLSGAFAGLAAMRRRP